MYSNKENVNILTALLAAHGMRHAVVCPGSRNAPLVHNLNEHPRISCHAITDERSAGFYALGIAQQLAEPVAVCVTSGSALLNVLPAVAEAFYQHLPLVVLSADRPAQWVDQLDGQTLPQPQALGRFVKKAVSLPEPTDDEQRWYCQRLVQEALLVADAPVHINIPISEPLFRFDTPRLPDVRKVERIPAAGGLHPDAHQALGRLLTARRPMVVVGQLNDCRLPLQHLRRQAVVMSESLFGGQAEPSHFDEVLSAWGDDEGLLPDCVLYAGDTLVSKRLKQLLRRAAQATFIRIDPEGRLADTFMHLDCLIEAQPQPVLYFLDSCCAEGFIPQHGTEQRLPLADTHDYLDLWHRHIDQARRHARRFEPPFSQMAAVKGLEQALGQQTNALVYYANSTAVRLANIYAHHHVWCNRGVNGIEGSLSAACGASLVAPQGRPVYCIIGDLSFFYDQNALWNSSLSGRLRILLLNNGGGGIFHMLPGLEQSPARERLVAGGHDVSAEGTCLQYRIGYRRASTLDELADGIGWLMGERSQRPLLLEVVTRADDDAQALKKYYETIG